MYAKKDLLFLLFLPYIASIAYSDSIVENPLKKSPTRVGGYTIERHKSNS